MGEQRRKREAPPKEHARLLIVEMAKILKERSGDRLSFAIVVWPHGMPADQIMVAHGATSFINAALMKAAQTSDDPTGAVQ